MNRPLRRKDREMPREFAERLLDTCDYMTLSMASPDGAPYAVPISQVRESDHLYFHCARQGQKSDYMAQNARVCFSCVGPITIPNDVFTVGYESCIGYGISQLVTEEEERLHALRLLCQRFVPEHMDCFDAEIKKSFAATAVYKITITHLTGKAKQL